jgi:hypothetical protein
MNTTECPCCDDGVVATWRVVATDEIILVCNECDSVWESADELPCPAATTVDQFLASQGLPLMWDQLQRLDQAPAA